MGSDAVDSRPSAIEEALLRAAQLSARQRHGDAARLLVAAEQAGGLTPDQRRRALRLRAEAWVGMRMDRRAWRDLGELLALAPSDPWARLQRARLLGRHQATDEVLADALADALEIARAHPDLSLAWRVAEELAGNQPRMGLQAEIIIGRARSDPRGVDVASRAAEILVQRGKHDDALALLAGVAIRTRADQRRLDLARVRVLFDARRVAELAEILPHVPAADPATALWLSRAWLATGQAGKAHQVLADHRPDTGSAAFAAWRLAMVALHCRCGELDDARQLVDRWPLAAPDDAALRLRAASGEWDAVAAQADQPWTRPDSRILVAEALRRSGRNREAKERLMSAQSMVRMTPPALLLNRLTVGPMPYLATACLDAFAPMLQGDPPADPDGRIAWLRDRADDLLDRLGGARDGLLSWVDGKGRLCVHWPRPDVKSACAAARQSLASLGMDGTIARYRSLMADYPGSTFLFTYRAEVRLWAGEYDAAAADLDRAIETDSRTRWAYVGRGLLALLQGKPQAAIDGLAKARSLFGELSTSVPVCAEALMRLGRISAAEQQCISALRFRPTRVSTWLLFAMCRIRLGRDASHIVAAFAAAYPELWSICEGSDDFARLDHALHHMRGNRSSGIVTWHDPRGWWMSKQALALLPPP